MAPIVVTAASSDEDTNLSLHLQHHGAMSNDKLDMMFRDVAVPRTPGGTLVVAEGRDEIDAAASSSSSDEEPGDDSDALDDRRPKVYKRQQSNLFSDEDKLSIVVDSFPSPGIQQTSYLDDDDDNLRTPNDSDDGRAAPPSNAFLSGLSLMPSFSPSQASGSSSPGGAGLEDISIGTPLGSGNSSQQHLFDESHWIRSQIDADEALARQLQEEENALKKKKFVPKASLTAEAKPVASLMDSIFGEPLKLEVKATYTKVGKDNKNNSNSSRAGVGGGADFPDSVSGGVSMLTSSFRKWGSRATAAANDFFGEDLNMQRNSSGIGGSSQNRSFGRNNSVGSSSPGGRYRNEV